MAQQTRVGTVASYYARFTERFPTVFALAEADLDEVLHVWQGLGYYARARHLHAAAGQIVERHGGEVPSDVEALRSLSGVGPYTAGAVASIAFGVAEPAVDGNARRVISRLFDLERSTPARLDTLARSLVDAAVDRPAEMNQAIMDLGGSVCSPRRPACGDCPVSSGCRALAAGTVALRPPRREPRSSPIRTAASAVVWRDGAVLFVRRPERGLLGGLWDFPGTKPEEGPVAPGDAGLVEELRDAHGIVIAPLEPAGEAFARIRHAFSHFHLELVLFETRWISGKAGSVDDQMAGSATGYAWVTPDRFEKFAVPAYLRSPLRSLGQGAR